MSTMPTMRDPLYALLRNNPDDFWSLENISKAEENLLLNGNLTTDDLESLKDLIECGLDHYDTRITTDEW
jgi:hypothetical protein